MHVNTQVSAFMDQFPCEGLTFDDVTLVTRYADFLPDETNLASPLTSRITLNIPFVSAAMDTVTEFGMATAMAMLGGIGVIHKNLPPELQAQHVRRVKQYLNGLIMRPVVFHTQDTLAHIQAYRNEHRLSFSGFPILDDQDRLAGIITSSDIRFAKKSASCVTEVMTTRVITAAPGTSLEEAYAIMMENKIGKLPLVDGGGRLVGLYAFTDVQELVENAQPLYTRDSRYRLRVAAAVSAGDHERMGLLAEEDVDVVVVDSAHGHSKGILDMVTWITKHYPDIDVIGGNVATGEGALALLKAGAHGVKVGIGPGSFAPPAWCAAWASRRSPPCTTRHGLSVAKFRSSPTAVSAIRGTSPRHWSRGRTP